MKQCPYCPAEHQRPDALDVIHTCTMWGHDGIDMTAHHLHTVAGRYLMFRFDRAAAQRAAAQDVFPPQLCPHCRREHPGQSCPLADLAQPLPI